MIFRPMKRTDVVAALVRNGCRSLRNSGRHEVFGCPCGRHRAPVSEPSNGHGRGCGQHRQADGLPSGEVAAMRSYTATAVREGMWWAVCVHGVGVTQGRSTAEAQRMAADLVAIMEDVPPNEVHVDIEFELPGELGKDVETARAETRLAEQAQRRAAKHTREAVMRILEAGLSKQDAARILKVSPQRISQLTKSA